MLERAIKKKNEEIFPKKIERTERASGLWGHDIKGLRTVCMTAERPAKTVYVRLVERVNNGWVEGPYIEYTIDGEHTLQERVQEHYAAFPGSCL